MPGQIITTATGTYAIRVQQAGRNGSATGASISPGTGSIAGNARNADKGYRFSSTWREVYPNADVLNEGDVVFNYFQDVIPGATPRPTTAFDEVSDQAWLSQEAGGPDAVFTYFDPPIPGAVPRSNAIDETSDQAWLSVEADLSGSAEFDYFVGHGLTTPSTDVVVEGADVAWSPDAQGAPSLDPTQIPWPLSVEPSTLSAPPDLTFEGADVSWSPDAQSVPAFDPTQEPWPLSVEPFSAAPIVSPTLEPWSGWISSEAGPGDAVFDYFTPPIPAWSQRATGLDETSDQAWLSVEADASGVTPFDFFVDAQRPNPSIGMAESADVSWSPDAFAAPFDPSTLPQPTSVEPPFVPPTVGPGYEPWAGWLASEAGGIDAVFDYFRDPPRALPPRADVPLDETSGQAWLARDAGGTDVVFDYVAEIRIVPQPPAPVEGADVSWSPDAVTTPFDPTQEPWPLFLDTIRPLARSVWAEGADVPWSPALQPARPITDLVASAAGPDRSSSSASGDAGGIGSGRDQGFGTVSPDASSSAGGPE
jgi:hypothetical protein